MRVFASIPANGCFQRLRPQDVRHNTLAPTPACAGNHEQHPPTPVDNRATVVVVVGTGVVVVFGASVAGLSSNPEQPGAGGACDHSHPRGSKRPSAIGVHTSQGPQCARTLLLETIANPSVKVALTIRHPTTPDADLHVRRTARAPMAAPAGLGYRRSAQNCVSNVRTHPASQSPPLRECRLHTCRPARHARRRHPPAYRLRVVYTPARTTVPSAARLLCATRRPHARTPPARPRPESAAYIYASPSRRRPHAASARLPRLPPPAGLLLARCLCARARRLARNAPPDRHPRALAKNPSSAAYAPSLLLALLRNTRPTILPQRHGKDARLCRRPVPTRLDPSSALRPLAPTSCSLSRASGGHLSGTCRNTKSCARRTTRLRRSAAAQGTRRRSQ